MAKWMVGKGMQDYIDQLQKIADPKTERGIIKHSIYEGARVVLDAMHDAIEALPTGPEKGSYVPPAAKGYMLSGITPKQKQGLLDGLGVAKMRSKDGAIETKVGFDGYNGVITRKFPKGQPNALIARAVESGTSFRRKNPFVSKTVKANKGAAEQAMATAFDEAMADLIK